MPNYGRVSDWWLWPSPSNSSPSSSAVAIGRSDPEPTLRPQRPPEYPSRWVGRNMVTSVPRLEVEAVQHGQSRRSVRAKPGPGARVFLGLTRVSALIVLAVIAAIGLFLTIQAFPALRVAKFSFLTTQAWQPAIHHFGVAGILTATI